MSFVLFLSFSLCSFASSLPSVLLSSNHEEAPSCASSLGLISEITESFCRVRRVARRFFVKQLGQEDLRLWSCQRSDAEACGQRSRERQGVSNCFLDRSQLVLRSFCGIGRIVDCGSGELQLTFVIVIQESAESVV